MIDLFRVRMAPEAREAVARVLTPDEQGRLYVGQGKLCEQFEREFGEFIGAMPKSPILLNSCTSAIDLALHLCELDGQRHEDGSPLWNVVTTPITCTATNSPPALRGAEIRWADVDPLTGNIDPASVAQLVDHRTKAIIAVNWGGRRCDYDALVDLCTGDTAVIEDAAHGPYWAHGKADYTCFSFQAIKHLTTGDGGALITPPLQHKRAKLLRWYGLSRDTSADFRCEQDIQEVGYKMQSNDIAAAIGLANLPGVEQAIARGRANAEYYHHTLRDMPGITLPPFDPSCSYWIFTILADGRDSLQAWLKERGIASSQVHARNDRHTAFKAVSTGWPLPGVDYFDAHQTAIPNGWWVSDEQREYIACAIIDWAATRARRAA